MFKSLRRWYLKKFRGVTFTNVAPGVEVESSHGAEAGHDYSAEYSPTFAMTPALVDAREAVLNPDIELPANLTGREE